MLSGQEGVLFFWRCYSDFHLQKWKVCKNINERVRTVPTIMTGLI